MKTRVEILEETMLFYSEDTSRRALEYVPDVLKDMCVYKTEDGRCCAVGRCIDEESGFNFSRRASVTSFEKEDYNTFFKEEYKGKNKGFWHLLQQFHDTNHYWDEEGITEAGMTEYKRLKNKFTKRNEQDNNRR